MFGGMCSRSANHVTGRPSWQRRCGLAAVPRVPLLLLLTAWLWAAGCASCSCREVCSPFPVSGVLPGSCSVILAALVRGITTYSRRPRGAALTPLPRGSTLPGSWLKQSQKAALPTVGGRLGKGEEPTLLRRGRWLRGARAAGSGLLCEEPPTTAGCRLFTWLPPPHPNPHPPAPPLLPSLGGWGQGLVRVRGCNGLQETGQENLDSSVTDAGRLR